MKRFESKQEELEKRREGLEKRVSELEGEIREKDAAGDVRVQELADLADQVQGGRSRGCKAEEGNTSFGRRAV